MAEITTITDANFDAVAVAVPAPFGPITRVGNVPDTARNSLGLVECESALDVKFEISYADLNNPKRRDEILFNVHWDTGAIARQLQALGLALVGQFNSYGALPVTAQETKQLARLVSYFSFLTTLLPDSAWTDRDVTLIPTIGTLNITKSGTVATVTTTLTGDAEFVTIDWGNGKHATTHPFAETFSVDYDYGASASGTFSIRVIVIGRGGVVEKIGSVVI